MKRTLETSANILQDIAPSYYNLENENWKKKSDMKTSLQRTVDKVRRKAAAGGPGSSRR